MNYTKQTYTFLLVPSPAGMPTSKSIPAIAEYYKDGERVRIQYARGQRSIFAHEQQNVNVNRDIDKRGITFNKGALVVKGSDKFKLDFLMNHPNRRGNEDRRLDGNVKTTFYLYDAEAEAKKENDLQRAVVNAMKLVLDGDYEAKLKPLASYFGVDVARPSELVMHDLFQIAQEDPEEFCDMYDSVQVTRYAEAREAFEKRILILDGTTVRFAGSKVAICKIPAGHNAEHYVADASFTEDAVKQAWSEVQKKLKGKSDVKDPLKPQDALEALLNSDKEEVAKMAYDKGLIEKRTKGSIFHYKDKPYKGYQALKLHFEENEEDFKMLCMALVKM